MIEPEDILGEACRRELESIRLKYKLAKERLNHRAEMFAYQVERWEDESVQ